MKQITIGSRSVLYTGTLLLRDGESAHLNIPVQETAPIGGEMLKLEVVFTNPESADTSVNWETEPTGIVKFNFIGWKNTIGTTLIAPQSFGVTNNDKLWFDMAHYRIGMVNIAHIVLSRGGQ